MDHPPGVSAPERREALARTRGEFLKALLIVIGAALVVGLFWLASRGAPSAGRDSELTPPAFSPTRVAPTPGATPS